MNDLIKDDGAKSSEWVIRVVSSCTNYNQLSLARKVIKLWYDKHYKFSCSVFDAYYKRICEALDDKFVEFSKKGLLLDSDKFYY